jgi:hypothetical protein
MLSSKHRFLTFAIGFALGCLLLAYIQQKKSSNRPRSEQVSIPQALSPWLGELVYVSEDEYGVNELIYRIRIIKDSGYKRKVRIKETLIVPPGESKRRIIARQVMELDQCVVTVRLDAHEDAVREWIESLGYVVVGHPLPNVYRVKMIENDYPDVLKKGLSRMEDRPDWVILIDPVLLAQQ